MIDHQTSLTLPWRYLFSTIVLPLGIYSYLRHHPDLDPLLALPVHHFHVTTWVSVLAAMIGMAIGAAGRRLRNMQVTFLALAFTALFLGFLLHGLATPGVLLPATPLPGVAAQLAVLLASGWLWLSALPSHHPLVARLNRVQPYLVPVWTAVSGCAGALLLAFPTLTAYLPLHTSPLKWVALVLTLGLLVAAGQSYWFSYRYSRFPLQSAILLTMGWMASAQVIMTTGQTWRLSWWLYHALLLLATLVMIYGLMRQYSLGTSLATAVQGLLVTDPVERIKAGISPSFRALILAVEARDPYTAGHNYRVAMYALYIGQAMGLPPEKLRALAQGGVVHDVGKLEVPDQILNKPGRLTPEERAIIERHPVTGYELCNRLGFMTDELAIIRHHHERWDGTGYPDRLRGEEIPLLARITAVADVYDALTSDRAYRKAWSRDEAVRFICDGAGTQFDPAVVQAFLQMVKEDRLEAPSPAWVLTPLRAGSP